MCVRVRARARVVVVVVVVVVVGRVVLGQSANETGSQKWTYAQQ